jgi:putative acetyltransferase
MRMNRADGKVTLRAAADLPAMLELWLEAWRATYADIDFCARSEWFLNHVRELEGKGALTFTLRRDESAPPALAGFVVIDPATGWLDQLCVHPKYFGAGVAQALLAAARRAAPSGVRLDVNADNRRALSFYEREGFMRLGAGAQSLSGRPTLVLEWRAPAATEANPHPEEGSAGAVSKDAAPRVSGDRALCSSFETPLRGSSG